MPIYKQIIFKEIVSRSLIVISTERWGSKRQARKELLYRALINLGKIEYLAYIEPMSYWWRGGWKSKRHKEGVADIVHWICPLPGERYFPILKLNHFVKALKISQIVSKNQISSNESLIVSFRIENIGRVIGKEIAQLYIRDVESSIERPIKELKGFAKIEVMPGETKEINLELKPKDFSFWDIETNDWIIEKGIFEILVGSSSQDIKIKTEIEIL